MVPLLTYTKLFPVESPVGVQQNEKEKDYEYHSIGVDVYVPLVSSEFKKHLLKSNPSSYIVEENSSFILFTENHEIILKYNDEKFNIFKNVQIPTGIAILIPKDYYITVNPKSSNFHNNYTVIEGFIDENYTYGFSVQLQKLDCPIQLKINQKFAQILLKKSEFVENMREISLDDFNEHPEVLKRREVRQGGFGHTGKFKV